MKWQIYQRYDLKWICTTKRIDEDGWTEAIIKKLILNKSSSYIEGDRFHDWDIFFIELDEPNDLLKEIL